MKKIISLLIAVIMISIGIYSCKKETNAQTPIVSNMNITLKQNESYTFNMPANNSSSAFRITTPASHYKMSLMCKNSCGGDIYQYTPALDYCGTDFVCIDNTGNGGGGCMNGGGNNSGGQTTTLNIHFTIGNCNSTGGNTNK